jgi:hypothetical protein
LSAMSDSKMTILVSVMSGDTEYYEPTNKEYVLIHKESQDNYENQERDTSTRSVNQQRKVVQCPS